MPEIEIGHWGSFEERQLVELTQGIRNVVVEPVNLPNPVHGTVSLDSVDGIEGHPDGHPPRAGLLAGLAMAGASMRHRSP
jgi:hypothetical protein